MCMWEGVCVCGRVWYVYVGGCSVCVGGCGMCMWEGVVCVCVWKVWCMCMCEHVEG